MLNKLNSIIFEWGTSSDVVKRHRVPIVNIEKTKSYNITTLTKDEVLNKHTPDIRSFTNSLSKLQTSISKILRRFYLRNGLP